MDKQIKRMANFMNHERQKCLALSQAYTKILNGERPITIRLSEKDNNQLGWKKELYGNLMWIPEYNEKGGLIDDYKNIDDYTVEISFSNKCYTRKFKHFIEEYMVGIINEIVLIEWILVDKNINENLPCVEYYYKDKRGGRLKNYIRALSYVIQCEDFNSEQKMILIAILQQCGCTMSLKQLERMSGCNGEKFLSTLDDLKSRGYIFEECVYENGGEKYRYTVDLKLNVNGKPAKIIADDSRKNYVEKGMLRGFSEYLKQIFGEDVVKKILRDYREEVLDK